MNKLITIAKNTFTETLRQPIYAVIVISALLLFALAPSLTMYALEEDDKLLREIGLSTLFLMSLFISIFSACGAVAEEIENKTILTVATKPVQRAVFVVAKFIGVAGAVGLAHFICTVALLMAIRHGVMVNAFDEADMSVVTMVSVSVLLTILLTAFFNYVYDWKFSSTAMVLLCVFAAISGIILACFTPEWKFEPSSNLVLLSDLFASVLLFFGALVIVALAVALSCRFNIVVTLAGCVGFFMIGLVSDYAFGRFAGDSYLAKAAYYAIPNLQVFWVSDAIYEESAVPIKYIFISAAYSICYVCGVLSLAVSVFQRRQLG